MLSRRKKQFFSRVDRLKKNWRDAEFILWGVPIFLVLLSGLLIASTQRQINHADWYLHWTTACLGCGIAFGLANSPLEKFRKYLPTIYLFTILSLIAVKLIGSSAFGAQRWLTIAGINIQPSEIAKLTTIFVLAEVLDRHQFKNLKDLFKPLILVFLPCLLVFIQPDLGTSLVFGAVLLIMLYWSGMPLEWGVLVLSGIITAIFASIMPWFLIAWIPFLGLLAYRSLHQKKLFSFLAMGSHGLIACATPWLWINVLKDYQRERLTLFLDPGKDPLGGGYHLLQSQIGIGSGGLWGTGILQGKLTQLSFIPEQHTDFIFSALGEETGFLGSIIVITSFFLFIVRLLNIARNARTNFESLFVIGVATMIMFQVMVNIFMTIGLGPVTGIPLPFMSYGRTALMVNFFALGFCLSVARRSQLISNN